MQVKIKRLNDKAILPTKAHATDAGYDRGVADEYHRLTFWHSPDTELPEYDKTILLKFDRTNLLFECYMHRSS